MIGLCRTAWRMKKMGVLGMNERNADFILPYNPRKLYPLVDDKLLTKSIAQKSGITVPELYGVISQESEIRNLERIIGDKSDFVIKPAQGSGGEGVIVVAARTKGMYRLVNGDLMNVEELAYHVSNILSGMFSLGGKRDKAIIEYRVKFDPVFEAISYQGVPDIRIIIFLGVPVMSMVRLPTRQSRGKANLHQGAIGAGIAITSGITMTAVWRNEIVTEHPDTGNSVVGVQVPGWGALLRLAASCYELTGLGYQGVDIVLDRDKGPMILEVNARPGLSIQIANRAGLAPRLRLVEEAYTVRQKAIPDIEERVRFTMDHFSPAGA
jgi:alpha-L-glutamate ligase-like protein